MVDDAARASRGWSRQAKAPNIVRDGAPYDPHLDRFFSDLPGFFQR
ncbi:hypothetical protein ABIB06_003909 [Bradyrhizobium sp. LB8.2]